MIVPTDLAVSLARLPIALKASYPALANDGWSLLSFVLSSSLVNPFVDMTSGPRDVFSDLYSLAKTGYVGIKADMQHRLDMLTTNDAAIAEDNVDYKTAKSIIDTPFVYQAALTSLDPTWVAMLIQLEQLVIKLETSNTREQA